MIIPICPKVVLIGHLLGIRAKREEKDFSGRESLSEQHSLVRKRPIRLYSQAWTVFSKFDFFGKTIFASCPISKQIPY